jgi:NAD/FAD-utilizing enzyme apparently involved in cell division
MKFDVVVVGAGHAGIEAAIAASKLCDSVGLFTINIDNIGQMSCNPAIGGIAKSIVVRDRYTRWGNGKSHRRYRHTI